MRCDSSGWTLHPPYLFHNVNGVLLSIYIRVACLLRNPAFQLSEFSPLLISPFTAIPVPDKKAFVASASTSHARESYRRPD